MSIPGRPSFSRAPHEPVLLGICIGIVFGVWNLVYSLLHPLAEDTAVALLLFYGPMFLTWGAAGFIAFADSHRLRRSIRSGSIVALVTFAVFTVFVGVRDNLLLDQLTARSDWQNLMTRFRAGTFASLRLYVNYIGITGAPFKLLVATAIGAVMGLLGGVAHLATRWRVPNEEL
jgi:hypothetical protein